MEGLVGQILTFVVAALSFLTGLKVGHLLGKAGKELPTSVPFPRIRKKRTYEPFIPRKKVEEENG